MPRLSRLADHVILTNHLVTKARPNSASIAARSLQMTGLLGRATWSGVYGTSSNRALWLAQRSADEIECHCFSVQTFVAVRDRKEATGQLTRDQVFHTGFMPLGRVEATFRSELRESVLEGLAQTFTGAQMDSLQAVTLDELTTRYPVAAEFLLDAFPSVTMVVHSAQLQGGKNQSFSVGTIRYQALAECRWQIRYLEDMAVA